jgi:hypothetical protein
MGTKNDTFSTVLRLLAITILVATFILGIFRDGWAATAPEVGETKSGMFYVCDTREQMAQLLAVHRDSGYQAASHAAKEINDAAGSVACDTLLAVLNIVGVYESYTVIADGKTEVRQLIEVSIIGVVATPPTVIPLNKAWTQFSFRVLGQEDELIGAISA